MCIKTIISTLFYYFPTLPWSKVPGPGKDWVTAKGSLTLVLLLTWWTASLDKDIFKRRKPQLSIFMRIFKKNCFKNAACFFSFCPFARSHFWNDPAKCFHIPSACLKKTISGKQKCYNYVGESILFFKLFYYSTSCRQRSDL